MLKKKDTLNTRQKAAVEHLLVLAGAGSGKTRVITYRIAHLINKRKIKPENILGVTFTNKAANEMRQRLAKLIGKKAESVTLSTFHSLGLKILRQHIHHLKYRRDFSIYAEGDQHALIRTLIHEHPMKREKFDTGIILTRISDHKNHSISGKNDFRLYNDKYDDVLPSFYENYQQALRACQAVDFDDLILLPIQLLKKHKDTRKHYQTLFQHILVDEYQDTNHGQFLLTSLLTKPQCNICVVGDDDQSIYGWRGAEVRNILEFEKNYPRAKTVKLEENYRSTKVILDAANHVIQNNVKRQKKKLWTRRARGKNIDAFLAKDENDEAQTIAFRIKTIQEKTKAKWSDFSVLYRSNVQSRALESVFRVNQIPYIVVGGYEFFERKEIKDIVAYLRAAINPRDDLSLLRILNYPRRGIGNNSILHLTEEADRRKRSLLDTLCRVEGNSSISKQALHGIRSFVEIVNDIRNSEKQGDIPAVVRTAIERSGYREELERVNEDATMAKMKIDIVEELVSAASAYSEQEKRPTLTGFIDSISLGDEPDSGREKNRRPDNAVLLVTLHSAKGLEFPYVFLCGMEEDLLPHGRSLNGGEPIDEERRLCYVGITRARRHLTLSLTETRTKFGRKTKRTPSRFIKEIPPILISKQFSHSPFFFDQQKIPKS